jgi:hypothetical protein
VKSVAGTDPLGITTSILFHQDSCQGGQFVENVKKRLQTVMIQAAWTAITNQDQDAVVDKRNPIATDPDQEFKLDSSKTVVPAVIRLSPPSPTPKVRPAVATTEEENTGVRTHQGLSW